VYLINRQVDLNLVSYDPTTPGQSGTRTFVQNTCGSGRLVSTRDEMSLISAGLDGVLRSSVDRFHPRQVQVASSVAVALSPELVRRAPRQVRPVAVSKDAIRNGSGKNTYGGADENTREWDGGIVEARYF
jgi:hypothetical protein